MCDVSAPPPSPQARRVSTPSWLDLRFVLGVVLVLVAVLAGAKIFSDARHTDATVAATRDLAPGTILSADDVTIAQVQLPGRGAGVYLFDTEDAIGRQLDRAVAKGELVPAAAVSHVRAKTTVTVPFAAGAAPDLRTGQRIEIWVSTPACSSVVLLPDVTVQAARADTSGSLSSSGDGQDVVISVAPPLAERVIAALALDQAELRAGVLVGAGSSTDAPLGDLTGCSSASPGR